MARRAMRRLPDESSGDSGARCDDLSAYGITHGYGLGLERYETDAVTVLGHLGTGLQGSFLGYDPASHTLVAVTSNTQNPESTAIMALETLTAISSGG